MQQKSSKSWWPWIVIVIVVINVAIGIALCYYFRKRNTVQTGSPREYNNLAGSVQQLEH